MRTVSGGGGCVVDALALGMRRTQQAEGACQVIVAAQRAIATGRVLKAKISQRKAVVDGATTTRGALKALG